MPNIYLYGSEGPPMKFFRDFPSQSLNIPPDPYAPLIPLPIERAGSHQVEDDAGGDGSDGLHDSLSQEGAK